MDTKQEFYTSMREHRKHLAEQTRSYYKDFEKYIITLSGGALGLSITFTNSIAGPNPSLLSLLIVAWVAFALAIFIMLQSVIETPFVIDKYIKIIDTLLSDTADEEALAKDQSAADHHGDRMIIYNYIAMGLFTAGLICLSIFAFNNVTENKSCLNEKSKDSGQNQSTSLSLPFEIQHTTETQGLNPLACHQSLLAVPSHLQNNGIRSGGRLS